MQVVPVGVVPLPLSVAAPAVPAVPADGVAAVAVDAGPRGVAEPHLPIGCGGDARTQVLAGRGGGRDQQQEDREAPDPRHWLMTSSRNRAARGSCDWPIQNSAFLRSSRSGSRRAMSISLSRAAASCRCPYTKISCSFISWLWIRSYRPVSWARSVSWLCPAQKSAFLRCSMSSCSFSAMSISQRRFSAPPLWDREQITFSLSSSSVSFAYRPRRYAALSAVRCCPSQKMALARASVRTSLRSTDARSAAPARGLPGFDSAKIPFSSHSPPSALPPLPP